MINLNLANFFAINLNSFLAVLLLGLLYVTLYKFIQLIVEKAYALCKAYFVVVIIISVFALFIIGAISTRGGLYPWLVDLYADILRSSLRLQLASWRFWTASRFRREGNMRGK